MVDMKKIRDDAFDGAAGTSKGERLLAEPILVEVLNETRDNANILKLSSDAGAGGGLTEAMVVTGLLATDEILAVTQRVAGANDLAMIEWNTLVDDSITAVWLADPGAGVIVDVMFRRATA